MKIIFFLLLFLTLPGCGEQKSPRPAGAPTTPPTSTLGDPKAVVAELNGGKITEAELNPLIISQLSRIQNEIYEIQKQGVDTLIEERLVKKEAEKKSISVEKLLKEEVTDKVGEVSDKEVEDFYKENRMRFGSNTLEQVKTPLKQQLYARKAAIYQENFLNRLKDNAQIKIFLKRPTVNVSVDDDPSLGNKSAKVTIIEFTDYQCPFCGRARPTVKQLIQDYGDKIHYVLRDFPLDFHSNAKKAAEAAECARLQDKYWQYSDLLWENQQNLDQASLKKYAGELKLNQKQFDECLDQGKFSKEVEKDFEDGAKAGVSGTPAFFINGQMLTGARPLEDFKEIIDEELKAMR